METVRIYFSENAYTTVPATSSTTVEKLCQQLHRKRQLPEPIEQYAMFVTDADNDHVFERRLAGTELPLEVQDKVRKSGNLNHFKLAFRLLTDADNEQQPDAITQQQQAENSVAASAAGADADDEPSKLDREPGDSDEEDGFNSNNVTTSPPPARVPPMLSASQTSFFSGSTRSLLAGNIVGASAVPNYIAQTMAADSSIVRCGYLDKRGKRNTAWKERWFVLRQGPSNGSAPATLSYYKSHSTPQPIASIPLTEAFVRPLHTQCCGVPLSPFTAAPSVTNLTLSPPLPLPHAHSSARLCSTEFEIYTVLRVYTMRARSYSEMLNWCHAIQGLLPMCLDNSLIDSMGIAIEEAEFEDCDREEKRLGSIMTLGGLLKDSIGIEQFVQFEMENHSEENVLFYLEAANYAASFTLSPHMKTPRQLLERARSIYANFLAPGADSEIHVPGETRNQIKAVLDSGEVGPDLFKSVQLSVFTLLQASSFGNFLTSKHFQRAMLKLAIIGSSYSADGVVGSGLQVPASLTATLEAAEAHRRQRSQLPGNLILSAALQEDPSLEGSLAAHLASPRAAAVASVVAASAVSPHSASSAGSHSPSTVAAPLPSRSHPQHHAHAHAAGAKNASSNAGGGGSEMQPTKGGGGSGGASASTEPSPDPLGARKLSSPHRTNSAALDNPIATDDQEPNTVDDSHSLSAGPAPAGSMLSSVYGVVAAGGAAITTAAFGPSTSNTSTVHSSEGSTSAGGGGGGAGGSPLSHGPVGTSKNMSPASLAAYLESIGEQDAIHRKSVNLGHHGALMEPSSSPHKGAGASGGAGGAAAGSDSTPNGNRRPAAAGASSSAASSVGGGGDGGDSDDSESDVEEVEEESIFSAPKARSDSAIDDLSTSTPASPSPVRSAAPKAASSVSLTPTVCEDVADEDDDFFAHSRTRSMESVRHSQFGSNSSSLHKMSVISEDAGDARHAGDEAQQQKARGVEPVTVGRGSPITAAPAAAAAVPHSLALPVSPAPGSSASPAAPVSSSSAASGGSSSTKWKKNRSIFDEDDDESAAAAPAGVRGSPMASPAAKPLPAPTSAVAAPSSAAGRTSSAVAADDLLELEQGTVDIGDLNLEEADNMF